MTGLTAEDVSGKLYEVTDDHSSARLVGTEDWRPIAEVRMEVGPLHLLPREGSDG